MLDIRYIRENTEKVKAGLNSRKTDYTALVDKAIELDTKRREVIFDNEEQKARQNSVNKSIPALKKEGKDVAPIFEELKVIANKIKDDDRIQSEIEIELENLLLSIPNIPDDSVPEGKDSENNVEIRKSGKPTEFSFEAKPHWDLGRELGILDPETAAKVSGARFHFYKGLGARLERAVINYFLDTHTKNGYTEVLPPYMVNRESMKGTGQLPKFEEDAFRVANNDYFLIPTAEVPVTNMHRNEILKKSDLPIKYCAYSACFRAEAGSAGRDQRGLIRQHQFNKVELVKFSDPETSFDELEKLTNDACAVLEGLGLPYRVMLLCTGDMGFSSAKTYDIEVWMPSYNRYVEISSCSCFADFQARRAAIRFKSDVKDKANFVHTLNGSGVAVGRTVAAILENFQNEDGSITVPEVLRPYMGTSLID
ncbi:MAG: serine--tRNA ligase [Clostridiales bacterium GWF2_36_10]|nr:MAG: serine--tRNA ligase [Clostridiales bacterium GWF2_36_10]HAN20962.1 serine--tRNA ligase [Clostridiales bacterium]